MKTDNHIKRCRACLCVGKHSFCLDSSNILEAFIFCVSMPISTNTHLPNTLCDKCYELVNQFNEFKQLCINSQKALEEEKTLIFKDKNEDSILDCEIKLEVEESEHDDNKDFDYTLPSDNHSISSDSIDFDIKPSNKKNKNLKRKRKNNFNENKSFGNKFKLECSVCGSKYKNEGALKVHELSHEGIESENKCDICNKTLQTWYGLRRHLRRHASESLISKECTICGKQLKYVSTFNSHMKNHLRNEERKKEQQRYICHICPKTFLFSYSLRTHIKTHERNGERNHECEICKKKYLTYRHLRNHIRHIHELTETFPCTQCTVVCRNKDILKKHLTLHTGIRPYACEMCKRTFMRKTNLELHMRTHTGEKPFSCEICLMRFSSKPGLVEHKRVHTGEKPFKCKICNHMFSQLGTRNRHIRDVHKCKK